MRPLTSGETPEPRSLMSDSTSVPLAASSFLQGKSTSRLSTRRREDSSLSRGDTTLHASAPLLVPMRECIGAIPGEQEYGRAPLFSSVVSPQFSLSPLSSLRERNLGRGMEWRCVEMVHRAVVQRGYAHEYASSITWYNDKLLSHSVVFSVLFCLKLVGTPHWGVPTWEAAHCST